MWMRFAKEEHSRNKARAAGAEGGRGFEWLGLHRHRRRAMWRNTDRVGGRNEGDGVQRRSKGGRGADTTAHDRRAGMGVGARGRGEADK